MKILHEYFRFSDEEPSFRYRKDYIFTLKEPPERVEIRGGGGGGGRWEGEGKGGERVAKEKTEKESK